MAIDVIQHLVEDPNPPVRLVAASSLLVTEPGSALAGVVLAASLQDPILRVREAALVLLDSLGEAGAALLEGLKETNGQTQEPDLAEVLPSLVVCDPPLTS